MSQVRDVTQFNDVTKQNNNGHTGNVTQQVHATDKRLKPKERKHVELWQLYLWWNEMLELRKRHNLRISSVQRGKSNMSDILELEMIEMFNLDAHVKPKNKGEREYSIFQMMVEEGQKVGPIWDWMVSHKGIGERLAAPILALIDDIGNFDTIAKLWRFAGYGTFEYWIDEKGKAQCPKEGWKWETIKGERYRVWTVVDRHNANVTQHNSEIYAIPQNKDLPPIQKVSYLEPEPDWKLKRISDRLCAGYHSPFCRPLKSILWNLTECMIKAQTPGYVDLYYEEKKYLREIHPEKLIINGKTKYNDGHINDMAKRKMRKEFLKNLWLTWREMEGLPVSEEYVSPGV